MKDEVIGQNTDPEALWRVERRAASDFRKARFRARLDSMRRRWLRWISNLEVCCESLECFSGYRDALITGRVTDARPETVDAREISGSVGRCSAFDGSFLPTCACSRERWKNVDLAFQQGKPLPPVELYKIGSKYFVHDGNHRVSVASYHNTAVDALVKTLPLEKK